MSIEFGGTGGTTVSENDKATITTEQLLSENEQESLNQSLWSAAQNGSVQQVENLILAGSHVNYPDEDGYTPLYVASMKGHTDVVKTLLKHTADPNISTKYGRTPLLEASINGHTEVVQVLLNHNADPNISDKDGDTPLIQASRLGHSEIVQILLNHRADPNISDEDGNTPLHFADNKNITEFLIEKGVNVSALAKDGRTPLHYAESKDIAECLIKNGANVSALTNDGHTPLHDARSKDIAECLINNGASVSTLTNDGNSVLHIVSRNGDVDTLEYLINKGGLNLNSVNVHGETPLHMAWNEAGVRCLINHGADISIVTTDGNNVLHSTCKNGNYGALEHVIKVGGFSLDTPNKSNHTPIDILRSLHNKWSRDACFKKLKDLGYYAENPIDSNNVSIEPKTQTKDHLQIVKLYKKNVRNNKRTLRLRAMKGILVGGPGVGKTITFKRLIGERRSVKIDGHSASSGIESPKPIHLYHADVNKTSVLIPTQGSWSSKSVEDEFYTCLLQCDKQHSQPYDSSKSANSMPLPTAWISSQESNTIQHNQIHNTPSASSAPSTSASTIAPPQIDLNKIQTLISEQKYEEIEKVLEGVNELTVLYMIDLGGQPEFFEIVPLILRGPSLNLIFVNLSLSLTEQFEVSYRHTPTDCSNISYTSTYSQLQMIHQVLATTASLNESERSIMESFAADTDLTSAFLIGTHTDKICGNRLESYIMDFEQKVKHSLEHTKLYNILKKLQNKEEWSFIFPINNYDGDDEEIRLLQKALTQQISYRFRPIELPMSWGIFHLLLRKEYEHIGLCSLRDALDLGILCSIGNEAEVRDVLKFFHLFFGTILYYHDVDALKDCVICDPNLVFKPISRIIAEAFGANPNDEQTVENMRNTGEIPQPVLSRALHVEDTILSMSNIVELLKYHNVLTTIKNADGNECLFMPCLLKPDDQLISKACNSLLFSFKPHGFQPVGLFYVLIAKLVKLEQFRIDHVRFRNKVGFFYGNTHVEIRSTVSHIQVIVDKYTHERCVRLHNVLQREINLIIEDSPHMRGTKLETCFYCPEAPGGSPHIAPLSDPKHLLEFELPELLCSKCGSRAIQLTKEQQMWLKEYNPPAVSTDSALLSMSQQSNLKTVTISVGGHVQGATSIPKTLCQSPCLNATKIKEKTVFKLLKSQSHRWDDFGRELEVPYDFREGLEARCDVTNERKLEKIIYKWFESKCTPVTWSTLHDALVELELMNIVEDIERQYPLN